MERMIDFQGKEGREATAGDQGIPRQALASDRDELPGGRPGLAQAAQGVARRGQDMARRQLGALIRGALTWIREHDRLARARADNVR